MHSIERYGIVALLFLVVTVVAVLMWDGGKEKGAKKSTAGLVAVPAAAQPAPVQATDGESRLSLVAEGLPGPLQRHPRQAGALDGTSVSPPGPAPTRASDPAPGSVEPPLQRSQEAPPATSGPREQPARDPVVGSAPSRTSHTYLVRAGDTLSEIAERELGSSRRWREIAALNPGLDPAKLRAGKPIQIPGARANEASMNPASSAGPVEAAAKKASASGSPTGAKTWKVGPGENLWRIAEKTLGDGKRWREIAALNPRVDPDRLGAGTVLVLPATATPASAPARRPAPKRAATPTVVASQGQQDGTRARGRVR